MPSAASLVSQRLRDQSDALRSAEKAARTGDAAGVHDLRVAMRRIRSALATFRPLFDTAVTEPLRDELRWAAGQLGQARDAAVVQELVDELLDDLGPACISGLDEAVSGLRARLHLDAAASGDVILETLDSSRYAAATAVLESVVADPPFTEKAEQDAKTVVRKALRKEARRLRERSAPTTEAAAEPDVLAAHLHDVRKAAKRLRYAAETAAPVTGQGVRRVARRAKAVQSVLGDHHDVVVTRATLRHLAIDEDAGVAAAFLLGHLDADEQRALSRLEHRGTRALERLDAAVDTALT